MEKFKVYKITNKLNNNFYIGYTKLSIEKRFKLHVGSKTTKMPIVSALKKYGIDNFIVDLLFEYDNKDDAVACEIELIEKLKPIYNVHSGGTGGAMYGSMNGMYGKKHSQEWLKNKSEAMSGQNNPMFGKTHSDDIKKVLSEKKLGNVPWNKGKKQVYSNETLLKFKKPKTDSHKNKLKKHYIFKSPSGETIDIFGLNQFCKENNLNAGAMSEVWNGKRNCYKGWTK
jgi:group I intron endonuclease